MEFKDKIELLINTSDKDYLAYGLSFDHLYEKICNKEELIDTCFDLGNKIALELKEKFGSIDKVLEHYNLEVLRKGEEDLGRMVFGYFKYPNEICIVDDTIRKLKLAIKNYSDDIKRKFTNVRLENVIICHEFFHYYESLNKKTIFTKTYRFNSHNILGFKVKSKLQSLSEITAMQFTKTFLGLEYSPYMLNYILLNHLDEKEADKIFDAIIEIRGDESNGQDNI